MATAMVKRTFTFSMTLYLSLVSFVIYLLFEQWYLFLKTTNNVSFLSYKEGMYNNCNTTKVSTNEFNTKLINIRDYMTSGEILDGHNKRLSLLIASIILFAYHLLDSALNCNRISINFLAFFAGYKANECEQSIENIPEQIPLDDLQNEIEDRIQQLPWQWQRDILNQRKPPNGSKTSIWSKFVLYVLSLIGLLMVIFIPCIPQLFYLTKMKPMTSGMSTCYTYPIYIFFDTFYCHCRVFLAV